VEVVDNGPAGWVEQQAAAKCGGTGYIIDASPLVTKHLFGLGCAGWSDCKAIQVRPVAKSTPTGPAGCVPQVPNVSIKIQLESIPGQGRDTCQLQGSKGIFDWKVGQTTFANVQLKNSGTAVAKGVKVGIERMGAALDIARWNIYSDWKHPGSFSLNDTDGMQSLPHESPGASFTLALHAISPGETKRVRLKLQAKGATFPNGHARLQAWVRAISGYYSKTSYDAAPSNTGGHQKQNGGNLRARYLTDVLEPERCDGSDNNCDGAVDEGGICAQPAPAPDSGAPTPDSGAPPDALVAPAPDALVAADDLGGGFVEGDGLEPPSTWPEAAEVVGSCAVRPGRRGGAPPLLLPLLLLVAIAGRRGRRRCGSRGSARRR
jgi:MYXO-CTERM domain-containing protein